jgi:hypothetical protein
MIYRISLTGRESLMTAMGLSTLTATAGAVLAVEALTGSLPISLILVIIFTFVIFILRISLNSIDHVEHIGGRTDNQWMTGSQHVEAKEVEHAQE